MAGIRWLAAVLLACCTSSGLAAQQGTPPLQEDARLRLRIDRRPVVVGSVAALDGDVLVLTARSGEEWIVSLIPYDEQGVESVRMHTPRGEMSYPLTSLKLEVSRGRRPAGAARGGLWGLAVGTVAGTMAMVAMGRDGDENDYWPEFTVLPGAVLGWLIGMGVGLGVPMEQWEEVPLPVNAGARGR